MMSEQFRNKKYKSVSLNLDSRQQMCYHAIMQLKKATAEDITDYLYKRIDIDNLTGFTYGAVIPTIKELQKLGYVKIVGRKKFPLYGISNKID